VKVTPEQIDAYQREGVALIPGLFASHVETLRSGVARNMDAPGPYASENERAGETGRFFDDYCNWERIPEFADVAREPAIADAAAALMGSASVQMFH